MSMIATRMPLTTIGMNGIALPTDHARESIREEQDLGSKKHRTGMRAISETVSTKTQDGNPDTNAAKRTKRKKDYDQESDGFVFTKSKRAKTTEPDVQLERRVDTVEQEALTPAVAENDGVVLSTAGQKPAPEPMDDAAIKTKKKLRRFPTTPDRDDSMTAHGKQELRAASPMGEQCTRSYDNIERIPSPAKAVTIEKKRRKHDRSTMAGEHTARILLPASDTPIIRRNKDMRQSMANGESRRSSSGMRGRRVSSMIDDGRWNAQPHAEVRTSEFYTMITPDLTEPRRMRLLLGWCGDRALPKKPKAPSSSSKEASEELQALQAARVIQEELSQELSSNATLSEWFSRDEEAPQPAIILRKKPNPRNILNAAKVEELERQLERLRAERQTWDGLIAEAADASTKQLEQPTLDHIPFSPPRPELLSPSQQEIFRQFQETDAGSDVNPESLQNRLERMSSGVEFIVDQFSHTVHAVATAKDMAGRMADRSLSDAAKALKQRDQDIASRVPGPQVDALDALRGLAKILNARK
ncbi:hypothetical protein AMS68_002008 [Peltaster fructicola]|uniref:Kinetochore protein mis13 n=1 Tax=Peltaster fructicola TaxID=286661 RepID=A0A6H0XPB4_9PEZI|nr:hypothetical protein AMS68_002008 [Peltaster fructicola]